MTQSIRETAKQYLRGENKADPHELVRALLDEDFSVYSLLFEIRKAAGDADGRLMQPELVEHIRRAHAERDALRNFVQALFKEWPEQFGLDGFKLQDLCVSHGLLRAEQRNEPCGECCQCAELGDGWPAECLRKTALLTGKADSAAGAEGATT